MPEPDNTDPYGIDLLLTPDGDLSVNPGGSLAVVAGPENCVQALQLRLRTHPDELPLHDDYGSALAAQAIGTKAGDDQLLAALARVEVQRILEADLRFLAARNLQAQTDPADPQRAQVSMRLELAGGEELIVSDLVEARIDEIDPGDPDLSIDEMASDLDEDALAMLDAADYEAEDLGEPDDFADFLDLPDPPDEID